MEYFDEIQFKSEQTITIKYSIERVRKEEQQNNIYSYTKNVGKAITNSDVASLRKMEIILNVEDRNYGCIVWEHDESKNYPWFKYLTSDLLRKLSEPNKQNQLMKNQKNIIFVGVNEFAPSNQVIPRIFKEIGCGGVSYQTQISEIKKYWSEKLCENQNITGICYFYYSLEREGPFYPLRIFWRDETDKIPLNL